MREHDREAMRAFFAQVDSDGVTNGEKARTRSQVIRRVATTPRDRSFEPADAAGAGSDFPPGVVVVDGKLVGFGIHILNEDVYPLQSFEIYLRGCDLMGKLDLSGCTDVVFVDVYRNRISAVDVSNMPSLRILGLQGNQIAALDPTELPACQGIDADMNRLERIDVSRNPELVELYVNDNRLTALDTTANPLLRHLYAEGNPLKSIRALAPDSGQPLELVAGDGGTVGLSFNPVYDAQWKETGEWQQSYHARAHAGFTFAGWFDEHGACVSTDPDWQVPYGESRRLTAEFHRSR